VPGDTEVKLLPVVVPTVTDELLIRLYVMPLPKGEVIVMVPVGMAHVGCVVTLAAGVAGADGVAFTTSPVSAVEVPQLLVAVRE
jgi:hypothetical protein